MIYKDNWDKSKERYTAFWQREVVDQCCCWVTAPRDKPLRSVAQPPPARDITQRWLDPEYRLLQSMHQINTTYYGGDAYPMLWSNLGPGVAAAYMGAGWRLAEGTVWFDADPPIKNWPSRKPVGLDMDSPMWRATRDMTELFCKAAGDEFIVGITDLGGSMDIAASLRGSDVLLFDLYDYPEEVKALVTEIDTAWKQAYDRLQRLMSRYMQGTAAWMGPWCPGRWYPLQCDFSAMISKKMFDEFVQPALMLEAGWFNHTIYHLDGPGEIIHLDSVLETPGITGVQCVPGTLFQEGAGVCYESFLNEQWLPVMKRIQAKGKCLVMNEVYPGELDELMEHLSPKGLFFTISCGTEEEAKTIENKIRMWR